MPVDSSSSAVIEPPQKKFRTLVGFTGDEETWDIKSLGTETWDIDGAKIPHAFVVRVSRVLGEYRSDCWTSSGMTALWKVLSDFHDGKKDARSPTEFNELLTTLGRLVAESECRSIDAALVKNMTEGTYVLRDVKPKYRRMTRPLQQQHSTMTNMNTPARGAISETPMRQWQKTPVAHSLQSPAIASRAQRKIGFGGNVEVDVNLPNGRRLSALDANEAQEPPSPLDVDSESEQVVQEEEAGVEHDQDPEEERADEAPEYPKMLPPLEPEEERVGLWDDLDSDSDDSWHTSDGGYNFTLLKIPGRNT